MVEFHNTITLVDCVFSTRKEFHSYYQIRFMNCYDINIGTFLAPYIHTLIEITNEMIKKYYSRSQKVVHYVAIIKVYKFSNYISKSIIVNNDYALKPTDKVSRYPTQVLVVIFIFYLTTNVVSNSVKYKTKLINK